MSSAPTQLAVAPTASNLVVTTTAQIQKDYLEEPLARQNSLGNRVRGGLKGKHLTRSHAMRESASPPRTPTPRSEQLATSPVSNSYSSSSETINDSNKMHVQSSSSISASSSTETSSVIVTSQHSQQQQIQQQQQQQQHSSSNDNNNMNFNVVCNQSQLDVDFPKLTPPKSSKCPRNRDQSQSSDKQQQQQINNSTNINDYNNTKVTFNSSGNSSGTGQVSVESVTISSNTTYNNKNGNNNNKMMMNETQLNMKSSSNGQNNNNMSNHIQSNSSTQVSSSHQNWNRQNSLPNEKQHQHQQQHQNNMMNNNGGCGISNSIQTVNTINSSNSSNANSPPLMVSASGSMNNDKDIRCSRIENQNSNCGPYSLEDDQSESPTDGSKNERLNKKHKSGANSKSSKPRLKNMGSSSSVEGGNSTSGFISRDSSTEQFTDQSGIDLVQFFKDTLNKNPRDRNMLMKIEKDLVELAHDNTRNEIKFPAMSSYNRMLIHRVAAFFGMEHNVDTATQQSVIVAMTKQTRIPDIRFKSLIRDRLSDEPRRSILKRDTHSFEDPRQGGFLMCPDRGLLDRKAKSFEEREEEYEKVRRRIFRGRDGNEINMNDEQQHQQQHYWTWSSSESSDQSARIRQQQQQQNNKLLKVHSLATDSRQDGRPSVSKSHSFGGYGGPPPSGGPLTRGDSVNSTKSAGPRLFSKQDSVGSTNTPWRLSPSSSGSIYHFDPSNLPPPSQSVPTAMYNNTTKSIGINTGTLHRKKNEKIRKGGGLGEIHNGNNNHNSNGGNNENNNSATNSNNLSVGTGTGNGGGNGNNGGSQGIESSIETLSESSAQTVLNAYNHDDNIDSDAQQITKDSHCHREMGDIQEEPTCNSLDENDKITGNNCEETNNDIQQKPKVKNQATSPNIPSPEPEETTQLNEVTTTNINSSNDTCLSTVEQQPQQQQQQQQQCQSQPQNQSQQQNHKVTVAANSTSSSPHVSGSGNSTTEHHHRKDTSSDSKTASSSSTAIVTYTNNYQSLDGSTVYPLTSNGPYPATTYQQGLDGSVYAVSQPMVYAYPPPMDGEIQGYFMPVFDQSGQRDANGTLLPATAQTIYQPAGGTATATAVVPVAYPTAPYGSAPIYQSQVVYSTADQFAPAASAAGQMQQYPVTYPVGYPYPYNGYWGQPMTYYVPQPLPSNAVSTTMIPPPITAATAVASNNPTSASSTISTVGGNNGKRNSPPQNLTNGQTSQSATPANTYQFAPGVPLTITSDPNGPTMYAIPQSAVFPNMLPYGPPSTPSAAAGVLTPLPHQHNAVISSLISHPSGPTGPPIPLEPPPACTNYAISNAGGNHGNNGGTPQSTPSTPLSTNVSANISHPPQARNPPLFATPPIMPNGFNSQMHNQYAVDSHNASTTNSSASSYEKKNMASGGNKKNSNNSYTSNNKQNTYTHNQQQNPRRPNVNENPNSQNNSTRPMHNNSMQQQKRPNEKTQISGGVMSNNMNSSVGNGQNNVEKPRSGIRPKPGNLDLRRNASQRNSPSTNSVESNNNSPNSIASNSHSNNSHSHGHSHSHSHSQSHSHNHSNNSMAMDHSQSMYIARGAHIPPMHQPTAAVVATAVANDPNACHQQLLGAYNHPPPPSMYIKYGQTYFAHPSVALPNNRRSPPNDLRPPLAPITGVYSTVNMMLPTAAPRQIQPRHANPNYKGNKPTR